MRKSNRSNGDTYAENKPNTARLYYFRHFAHEVLPRLIAPDTYAYAQVRRNHIHTANGVGGTEDQPDSDGGTCVASRPYFYSAGADGQVGIYLDESGKEVDGNADNVYTIQPKSLPKPP